MSYNHHHYIACKDYDKAITRKIQSAIKSSNSSSMTQSKQNGNDSKETQVNKRIMIIDDDEDTNLLFKIVLEASDHNNKIKVNSFNCM